MTRRGTKPGTALVTGGATRIGRAISLRLATLGWAVAVHYRESDADAQTLADEIEAAGGAAVTLDADLAIESQTAGLMARAAMLGPVTCLVNNAAEFERDEITDATRESWDMHMETNLRAPFVLCQAMARDLPADAQGAIINLIDQRVWNLTPHFMSYTLSKAGLWTLTRTLALALAPDIRVNAIGPGPTLPSKRQSPTLFAAQQSAQPLGRGAAPDEIADAVAYLLDAPAVTGQMLALDGGQHLGWSHPTDSQMIDE